MSGVFWYVLFYDKDGKLRGSVGPFSTEDNAHDHARRVVLPGGIELTLTVEPRWRCASLRVDHMCVGLERIEGGANATARYL